MAEGVSSLLVASVLPADFADLGRQVQEIEKAGVDRVQWDVMDGRFVPNITFGPDVIASCRDRVDLGFEAHLMVSDPDPMLARWVDAGCGIVIVHAEATPHLHRTLGRIRELGARAGVALNPATPLAAVEHVLDLVDLLLVMTVNPGFGGQAYLPGMEPKIAAARAEIDRRGLDVELEVDGGIGTATIGGRPGGRAGVLRRVRPVRRAGDDGRSGAADAGRGRSAGRGCCRSGSTSLIRCTRHSPGAAVLPPGIRKALTTGDPQRPETIG